MLQPREGEIRMREHTTYTEKNGLEGVQCGYIETVNSCNCSLIFICTLSQYVRICILPGQILFYMWMLSAFKLKISCVKYVLLC